MSTQQTEAITIYSDYVCPFCYLGRESLSRYQADRETPLEIDWQPFDLRSEKRNADGSIDHPFDDGKDDDYFEQAKESVRRLQEKYDVEMTMDLATEVDSLHANGRPGPIESTARRCVTRRSRRWLRTDSLTDGIAGLVDLEVNQ